VTRVAERSRVHRSPIRSYRDNADADTPPPSCRNCNGVPDEEIMGHTGHRSLTTIRSYVRRAKLSRDSPAGKLGLYVP
jgi:hypothetical protein